MQVFGMPPSVNLCYEARIPCPPPCVDGCVCSWLVLLPFTAVPQRYPAPWMRLALLPFTAVPQSYPAPWMRLALLPFTAVPQRCPAPWMRLALPRHSGLPLPHPQMTWEAFARQLKGTQGERCRSSRRTTSPVRLSLCRIWWTVMTVRYIATPTLHVNSYKLFKFLNDMIIGILQFADRNIIFIQYRIQVVAIFATRNVKRVYRIMAQYDIGISRLFCWVRQVHLFMSIH